MGGYGCSDCVKFFPSSHLLTVHIVGGSCERWLVNFSTMNVLAALPCINQGCEYESSLYVVCRPMVKFG